MARPFVVACGDLRLDLAFLLPAVAVGGVLLLRRHPLGRAAAPGQLVFLALACVPIMVTPPVAELRGYRPGWSVLLPVGLVLAATVTALTRVLREGPQSRRA